MSFPESLSRREKREARRIVRISTKFIELMPGRSSLTPIDTVLEQESDLTFLTREQNKYRSALTVDVSAFQLLRLYSQVGFSEGYIRDAFIDIFSGKKREVKTEEIFNLNILRLNQGLIDNFLNTIQHSRVVYRDEDDEDILRFIEEDTDIPILDLLREKVRIQGERVDLLGLQVAYLKEEERKTKKLAKKPTQKPNKGKKTKDPIRKTLEDGLILTEQNSQESTVLTDSTLEFDNPFLPPWKVFWTTRFFSAEPNHLVELNCGSRTAVLEDVQRLGQGQISIRPQSILSALEFHLSKDLIQRALSMKNKYGPEGIKDWVKIKRGNDRIFLFLEEELENRLVFFAAGRDIVYRGI